MYSPKWVSFLVLTTFVPYAHSSAYENSASPIARALSWPVYYKMVVGK